MISYYNLYLITAPNCWPFDMLSLHFPVCLLPNCQLLLDAFTHGQFGTVLRFFLYLSTLSMSFQLQCQITNLIDHQQILRDYKIFSWIKSITLRAVLTNFNAHTNHPRILLNTDPDTAGLGWGLKVCISKLRPARLLY